MKKEAVRIKVGGTTVSFYKNEIVEVQKITNQPNIIHRLRNGKPIIYFTEVSHRVIEITFDLFYDDTMSKITTLREYDGYLTCYYRYGVDEAETYSVNVHMMKADLPEPFWAGQYKRQNITAIFIEGASESTASYPIPLNQRIIGV